MQVYQYRAKTVTGDDVVGELTAANSRDLVSRLQDQQIFPLQYQVKSTGEPKRKQLRASQRLRFFSNLADLLDAGVPLVRSLDTLQHQTQDDTLRQVIERVQDNVQNGQSLASAMELPEQPFRDLETNIIKAGEAGGFLQSSLQRIAEFIEQEVSFRSRIQNAIAYPLFLVVVGILVVSLMFFYFIPRFAPFFDQLAQEGRLPLATTLLLNFSATINQHFLIFLLLMAGGLFTAFTFLRSERGLYQLDTMCLKLWGLSTFIKDISVARLTRVLGTLLKNRVSLPEALSISAETTGNRKISELVTSATDEVVEGNSLAGALKRFEIFSPDLMEMIAVGEEANELDTVLIKVAEKCEKRTDQRMGLFIKFLEPVMLLIIAAVVLFVIIALQVPILQLGGSL